MYLNYILSGFFDTGLTDHFVYLLITDVLSLLKLPMTDFHG